MTTDSAEFKLASLLVNVRPDPETAPSPWTLLRKMEKLGFSEAQFQLALFRLLDLGLIREGRGGGPYWVQPTFLEPPQMTGQSWPVYFPTPQLRDWIADQLVLADSPPAEESRGPSATAVRVLAVFASAAGPLKVDEVCERLAGLPWRNTHPGPTSDKTIRNALKELIDMGLASRDPDHPNSGARITSEGRAEAGRRRLGPDSPSSTAP